MNDPTQHQNSNTAARRRCAWPVLLSVCLLLMATTGCATVKPWERDTQALAPMKVEDMKCQRFERSIEVYREGAVGANGGKSGGGCGCS